MEKILVKLFNTYSNGISIFHSFSSNHKNVSMVAAFATGVTSFTVESYIKVPNNTPKRE